MENVPKIHTRKHFNLHTNNTAEVAKVYILFLKAHFYRLALTNTDKLVFSTKNLIKALNYPVDLCTY